MSFFLQVSKKWKIVGSKTVIKSLSLSTNRPAQKTTKAFREIPGPNRLPVIGNLHLFSKFGPYTMDKLYDAYSDLHDKYGPIVRLDIGISIVALFRPEDIQKLLSLDGTYPRRPIFEALRHYRLQKKSSVGLITDNGSEWKRLRRAVNFLMRPDFVQTYWPVHSEIADDFVLRVRHIRDSNNIVPDFLKQLYCFTGEAIGSVCFGRRLGLLSVDDEDANLQSSKLAEAADETLEALCQTMLGLPWWKIFNTPTYKKLVRSQRFFENFSADCLADAQKEMELNSEKAALQFLKNLMDNKDLPPQDLGLLMTELFSAGIDTTGNAIAFLLYNLCKNPVCQDKLYEIQNHLQVGNSSTSWRLLNDMPYLRACIKESFRLTPTSGGTARILNSAAEFCGFEVPQDVLCIGIHPIICKQNKYFDNPLQFIPERWLNPEVAPHQFCSLPFSHGVRRCVGQRIAEQEIRLCIIKILQNFKVEYNGPDVGSKMRLQLIPDKPLAFKFIDR